MILRNWYAGCNTIEMRVHDIVVVADLDEHRPPEPVVFDGTTNGKFCGDFKNPDSESIATYNDLSDKLAAISFHWLATLWPRLLATFTASTFYGGQVVVQLSIDLLGDFVVESLEFETPLEDGIDQNELVALQTEIPSPIEDLGGVLGVLGNSLATSWYIIDTLVSFGILGPTATETIALISAFLVLWGGWLLAIDVGVNNGYVCLATARALTIGFAYGLAGEIAFFPLLVAAATYVKHSFESTRTFFSKMKEVAGRWGIISFCIKVAVFLVTICYYIKYYEMALCEYLQSQ